MSPDNPDSQPGAAQDLPVNSGANQIDRLMAAVVQTQDAAAAVSALESLSVMVTRLPSVGGFLGRTNVTLLIGLPSGLEGRVVQTLQERCRQRVEVLASPVEGAPVPLSAPIPVTVGGATIFVFEIERYEEI